MRNRLFGLMLASIVATLASSHAAMAQTSAQPNVSKSHSFSAARDLSGVWRRSRRAPDKARRYTIYELAFSITNETPPMTPWAVATCRARV